MDFVNVLVELVALDPGFFMPWVVALTGMIVLTLLGKFSSNRILQWAGRLSPVLLLIYIRIPIDFITSILWIIAALIVLISTLILLLRIIAFGIRKLRKKEVQLGAFAKSLVSPSTAIAAIFLSQAILHMSVVSANRHAVALAKEMRTHVEKTGRCKETIEGWESADNLGAGVVMKLYGAYGTKHRISYHCHPEFDRFSFQVRINQDSSFSISHKTGDDDFQVGYGHYAASVELVLDESVDLDAVVKMEYKAGDNN